MKPTFLVFLLFRNNNANIFSCYTNYLANKNRNKKMNIKNLLTKQEIYKLPNNNIINRFNMNTILIK